MEYRLLFLVLLIFCPFFGQVNLGNDITLCEGEAAILDASPNNGFSYLWSTGETSPEITVTTAGTYSVTVGSNSTQNLLVNGNFSNQANAWNFLGNSVEAVNPQGVYGGFDFTDIISEIDPGVDGIPGTSDDASLSQNVTGLVVGSTYTLCFDYSLRTEGGPNPCDVLLEISGVDTYTITATNTLWELQNACFTFQATSNNHVISLTPLTVYEGRGMMVDNFVLRGHTTDEIQVNFVAPPLVDAGPDQFICMGSDAILVGLGNSIDYLWDNGVVNNQVFNPTITNTYTLVGSIGECTSTDQVTINIIPLPAIEAGLEQTICNGSAATLNGSGGISYTWNNLVTDGVPFVPAASANYIVIGEDENGCTSSDEVAVTLFDLPVLIVNSEITICQGNAVTLTATGSGISYTWSGGITNGIEFIPAMSQIYSVLATDENGCTGADEVSVNVTNPADLNQLDLGPDQEICIEDTLQLFATGVWSNFLWSNSTVNQSTSVFDTGLIWCEVLHSSNCVLRDTILIVEGVKPVITIAAFENVSCAPFSIAFNAISSVPGVEIFWDFGDFSIPQTGVSLLHTYQNPGTYDLTLSTDEIGLCSSSLFVSDAVQVLSLPLALFSYEIVEDNENTIKLQFQNNSINYSQVEWHFTGTDSSEIIEPSFNFSKEEDPTITLLVSNGYCSDTMIARFEIPENLIYYVPNSFTPDGNKFNNVFQPIMTEGFDEESYQLRIFDRWGELMFQSEDSKVGWDGTYKNKIVKSDTYNWNIKFKIKNQNDVKNIFGNLNLLK